MLRYELLRVQNAITGIGIECEVGGESSEIIQRPLTSVTFEDSMKHCRAVVK